MLKLYIIYIGIIGPQMSGRQILYRAIETVVPAVQAWGFYVLVAAICARILYYAVVKDCLRDHARRLSLRAANDPARVEGLKARQRAVRLAQARRFQEESMKAAKERAAAGKAAAGFSNTSTSTSTSNRARKKKQFTSSRREYNPLLGHSGGGGGYKPSRRAPRGGGG